MFNKIMEVILLQLMVLQSRSLGVIKSVVHRRYPHQKLEKMLVSILNIAGICVAYELLKFFMLHVNDWNSLVDLL